MNRTYALTVIRYCQTLLLMTLLFGLSTACPGTAGQGSRAADSTFEPPNPKGFYVRGPEKNRVIIFVNGIFGDAQSTWKNSSSAYWPQLIGDDSSFADSDIFVLSFESPKIRTAQNIDDLAIRMGAVLTAKGVLSRHNELVFLCHSMGGLVTRKFLVKERLPAESVPLIYFFGTPTAGANVTRIAEVVSANPQLRDMLPLEDNTYLSSLANDWLATATQQPALDYPGRISSYCSFEKLDTFGVRIVTETSAKLLCNRPSVGINANHINIVKPGDVNQDPYVFFKAAYLRSFGAQAADVRSATRDAVSNLEPGGMAMRHISSDSLGEIVRRTVSAPAYVDVGCEETKGGVLEIQAPLKSGEYLLGADAIVTSQSNLSSINLSLIGVDATRARVQFNVRGLDRVLFNCPGGGNAHIAVNFVVAKERSSD